MILERGRHTHYQFYVGNTSIETVTSFKYLGIPLYKNGNWARTLKYIARHASYSLFNIFHAEFSFEKKLQRFDSHVGSILNFGSQV